MALTYKPEDTSDLNLKSQRDVHCGMCNTRRTVDLYDEPSVAGCINEGCGSYFVIPAYPTQNSDIIFFKSEDEAMNKYKSLK